MILKLIGLGCLSYLRENVNIYDMLIVILSTIDMTMFVITKSARKDMTHIGNIS